MKITWIDLRPYGYIGKKIENGYIYCPFMSFSHETEEELQEAIKQLEEDYKHGVVGKLVDPEDLGSSAKA